MRGDGSHVHGRYCVFAHVCHAYVSQIRFLYRSDHLHLFSCTSIDAMPPSLSSMSILLPLGFAALVAAHDNGMDMSMDGGMDLAMGQMLTYLHFTPGDMLWFMGWVPASTGAMVGTCIGLFLLAIIERWIAACRAVMQGHWAKRYVNVHQDESRHGLNLSLQSANSAFGSFEHEGSTD